MSSEWVSGVSEWVEWVSSEWGREGGRGWVGGGLREWMEWFRTDNLHSTYYYVKFNYLCYDDVIAWCHNATLKTQILAQADFCTPCSSRSLQVTHKFHTKAAVSLLTNSLIDFAGDDFMYNYSSFRWQCILHNVLNLNMSYLAMNTFSLSLSLIMHPCPVRYWRKRGQVDYLVQSCRDSIANVLEFPQCCADRLKYS